MTKNKSFSETIESCITAINACDSLDESKLEPTLTQLAELIEANPEIKYRRISLPNGPKKAVYSKTLLEHAAEYNKPLAAKMIDLGFESPLGWIGSFKSLCGIKSDPIKLASHLGIVIEYAKCKAAEAHSLTLGHGDIEQESSRSRTHLVELSSLNNQIQEATKSLTEPPIAPNNKNVLGPKKEIPLVRTK
ncbi:MAG: hypothetical protein WBJ81_02595 [Rickettsiales bacterium]